MKIIIATGIYPPEIGGPSQYAFNLKREFESLGFEVVVVKFSSVRRWPMGLRHLLYFFKLLLSLRRGDWCLALDNFSVALPAVLASRIRGSKIIIRNGGDFLWEQYVERSGDLVLLSRFYESRKGEWSPKEHLIFKLSRLALKNCHKLVFSTIWQRDIFLKAYGLKEERCLVIENYYGLKEKSYPAESKVFLTGTRPLKWKNGVRLNQAFERVQAFFPDVIHDSSTLPFPLFMEKLSKCYAVVLVSLGDISPNLILDAVRYNKPFILTRETGLSDRLKDIAIFADPEDAGDIARKICWLAEDKNYREMEERIKKFNFIHSWSDVAQEFVDTFSLL